MHKSNIYFYWMLFLGIINITGISKATIQGLKASTLLDFIEPENDGTTDTIHHNDDIESNSSLSH